MGKIGVLGAGSWGTALAIHLARQNHEVTLWARDRTYSQQMQKNRENPRYLPRMAFPSLLSVTANLSEAVKDQEALLVVLPSTALDHLMPEVESLGLPKHLAFATKGFVGGENPGEIPRLINQAWCAYGHFSAVISGPTFALEVARGLPTALVCASEVPEESQWWLDVFQSETFRPYGQSDVVGVEVGGAVKNVIAIAVGISDGLGFGANARAALITRGLAEMTRLAQALGGQKETLMGLAGLGDLVLTATDSQSRNRRFGLALGAGKSKAEALAEIGQVVEGVVAAQKTLALAQALAIDMPIVKAVHALLFGGWSTQEAVDALMGRQTRHE